MLGNGSELNIHNIHYPPPLPSGLENADDSLGELLLERCWSPGGEMESSPVTFLPVGLAGFEKVDDSLGESERWGVRVGGSIYNHGKVGVRNGFQLSENGIHFGTPESIWYSKSPPKN